MPHFMRKRNLGHYTDMVSYIKCAVLIRLVEETVNHKENL